MGHCRAFVGWGTSSRPASPQNIISIQTGKPGWSQDVEGSNYLQFVIFLNNGKLLRFLNWRVTQFQKCVRNVWHAGRVHHTTSSCRGACLKEALRGRSALLISNLRLFLGACQIRVDYALTISNSHLSFLCFILRDLIWFPLFFMTALPPFLFLGYR